MRLIRLIVCLLLCPAVARAQSSSFLGNGAWNNPGSWLPVGVPDGITYNVFLPNNSTINGLGLNVSVGSITTGGTIAFNNVNSQTITVANSFTHSSGTLNLQSAIGIILDTGSVSTVIGSVNLTNGAGVVNRGRLALGSGPTPDLTFTPISAPFVANQYELRNDGALNIHAGILFNVNNARVLNTGEFTVVTPGIPGGNLLQSYDQNVVGARNRTSLNTGTFLRANTINITTGELYVAGTLNGSTTNFSNGTSASVFSPGTAVATVGTATFLGNSGNLTGSLWNFDIGGTAAGTGYDQVIMPGGTGWQNLNLSGRGVLLGVSLINGFTPAPTDSFTIASIPNVAGMFTNVTDNTYTIPGRGTFAVTVGSNQVVLSNFVAVPEPSFLLPGPAGLTALLVRRRR